MRIEISIPRQDLVLLDDAGGELCRFRVSTAKNGAGEKNGSFCTPRGEHIVRAKIGSGAAPNTIFVRRRPTGEIWSTELASKHPGRDWILTRILWLSGCNPGFNRLGDVDTILAGVAACEAATASQPSTASNSATIRSAARGGATRRATTGCPLSPSARAATS